MWWILPVDLLLVVALILGTILTETESFGWATLVLLASVVGAQFVPGLAFLHWAQEHLLLSALYVVVYLVVGVGWSFGKWLSFLFGFRDAYRALKEEFEEAKASYFKSNPDPKSRPSGSYFESLNSYIRGPWSTRSYYHGQSLAYKPKASNNKARIVAWMAYWPLSAIGTLLNDPIRRLFNWLFTSFKALYQKLADWVFRNEEGLQ